MKIGEFARKHNLSIPTLRYYISLGLILPKKNRAQYDFSEKNEKEMETILELRHLGFSLRNIINYVNTLRLFDEEDADLYDRLFPLLLVRKDELSFNLAQTKSIIGEIDEKINKLKEKLNEKKSLKPPTDPQNPFGLHTDFLQLIVCPICGKNLGLKDAALMQNIIISGFLFCDCGYNSAIKDGILYVNESLDLEQDNVFFEDYFGDFKDGSSYDLAFFEMLDGASSEYLTMQHKAREWINDNLLKTGEASKVILFPDVSVLFLYLYHDASYLKDSLIIVTGLSKNGLIPIQRHLALSNISLKIAFVVSPDCSLPFKDKSISLMIDYLGTHSYAFFKNCYFYDNVDKYFTEDAKIICCLDYYNSNSDTLENIKASYKNSCQPFLGLEQHKILLQHYGYTILKDEALGSSSDTTPYFEYHSHKDQRHSYVYLAKRDRRIK